ncbi:hypothetical protein HHK36_024191 [Tetracentron sinense]|uniref:Integrase catalytic domain-containing protein n=1 Tax=Tetracentron sinense TaxID=13715 RepID=A0A835D6G6_TETSI|nr:hypothetical protein HHK36_024191 [Tetracentron sinense]
MATNNTSVSSNPQSSTPLIAVNAAAQLPHKLTPTNFPAWRCQFESLLIGYDRMGYLDGTLSCPSLSGASTADQAAVKVAYSHWIRQDKLLLNAILAGVSEGVVSHIATAETSMEAWKTLTRLYASQQVDELALIDAPVTNDDLTLYILNGLGLEYREIVAPIRTRATSLTFEELHDLLLGHERYLKRLEHASNPPVITANISQRRYNNRSSQKNDKKPTYSRFGNSGGSFQSKPTDNSSADSAQRGRQPGKSCHFCGFNGHTVTECRKLRRVLAQANCTIMPQPATNRWMLDSGASHNITSELQNMSMHSEYEGLDEVVIGEGTGLNVTHVGSTNLSTPSKTFALTDLLCVPSIHRNLISVHKFTSSNNCYVEFNPFSFSVKDLSTGVHLLQGKCEDGIYYMPQSAQVLRKPPVAFVGVRTSLDGWHSRLGHPSTKVVTQVVRSFDLPLEKSSVTKKSLCVSCQCNKSHKQPFSISSMTSSQPFELIYSDVWGPSSIKSINGYRFYVIFIDHFTKFTWFYPLKQKSDVESVFINLHNYITNQFTTTIKHLYTDNGGEYLKLRPFLAKHGITSLTTPPHTPQHNGVSERRHRHLVETGLTLLHHSKLPLSYWSFAFETTCYLINRMPTPLLHGKTPFESLTLRPPNYLKLRTFGCLCYPWLKPYNNSKLDPKSTPCVFLGYSLTQSAYKCLDIKTHRLYLSRHACSTNTPFLSPPTLLILYLYLFILISNTRKCVIFPKYILFSLEVNKPGSDFEIYFRKGKVGDSANYLTSEMIERLDQITELKFHGSGLSFSA